MTDPTTRPSGGILEGAGSGRTTWPVVDIDIGGSDVVDVLGMSTSGTDYVTASPLAAARIASSYGSGAFVIDGIECRRESVELDGGRYLVVDAGIYGVARG